MTIAMEDESSFTLSSSSSTTTLSSQSNLSIQMLNQANCILRDQTISLGQTNQSTLLNSLNNYNGVGGSQSESGGSPNGGDYSFTAETCPFALFLIRTSNGLDLFEERRISLDKPCKIGRSVAKIRPEANNAIFDCKVLSRNHALLWHENSKFYIQDTKSSNGTFLNGNRLGKSNEDSAPYELSSGDIVQFGVDVTENTKKVTHGCITVEIKLYHKQGVEATNKSNPQSYKVDVQTQELYQLALFLQEAMAREEMLHQKINSLQAFIEEAKETSENGWLTLISEDRLLSRIDFLEKQTLLHTKTFSDENMTKLVNSLRDEKLSIENEAKATVQKMIKEKNEISQKYDELKNTLSVRTEECNQLQRTHDDTKKSMLELATKYQDVLSMAEELKANFDEAKNKFQEQLNESEAEKLNYEAKLASLQETETHLKAKIESLMAEKDFQKKDFERIVNKYEQSKNEKAAANEATQSPEVVVEGERKDIAQPVANNSINNNNINNHSTNQHELDESEHQHDEVSNEVDEEDVFFSNNHESKNHETNKNVLIEVTDTLLNKEKLAAKHKLINSDNNSETNAVSANNNSNSVHDENDENSYSNGPVTISLSKSIEINGLSENASIEKLNHHKSNSTRPAKVNCTTVTQTDSMADLDKIIGELESVKAQLALETSKNGRLVEENKQLKSQTMDDAQELKPVDQSADISEVAKLQEELKENNAKLKSVESELTDKVELIKKLLAIENKMAASQSSAALDNQEYVVLKDECIEMKNRLQIIENKMMKYLNSSSIKMPNTEELSAALMTEECKLFEQSYQQLQQLKENIQDKESKIQLNLTDAQKEADQNQQKLLIVQEQLQKLEETCENYKNRLLVAERTVKELNGEYDHLSLRTKIVSYFSTVPLFILILAIMVAFYPILATITATGL